ncbi:MAG: hypothetical protein ACFFG0_00145 [Candidatus Thorarchaeota archaeon]
MEPCSCNKFYCPENIEICPCRICLVRSICTTSCDDRYKMRINNHMILKGIVLNIKVVGEET